MPFPSCAPNTLIKIHSVVCGDPILLASTLKPEAIIPKRIAFFTAARTIILFLTLSQNGLERKVIM